MGSPSALALEADIPPLTPPTPPGLDSSPAPARRKPWLSRFGGARLFVLLALPGVQLNDIKKATTQNFDEMT